MSMFRRVSVQRFSAALVVVAVTALASTTVLAQAPEAASAPSKQVIKAQKKAQRKAARRAARAKNSSEVSAYKKNGYSPSNKDLKYPSDLQKAQQKMQSPAVAPASAP